MKFYSQHTPGYREIKLGYCADSLWSSACFLTSWCNFLKLKGVMDISPKEMNEYFKTHGLWGNSCLINAGKIADHFGFIYTKTLTKPIEICIAETDAYKAKFGVPQHFFMFDGKEKTRVDPLDALPDWEQNDYHLVSYRVFTAKENPKPAPIPEPKVYVPEPPVVTPEPPKVPEPILEPLPVEPPVMVEKKWLQEVIDLLIKLFK